MKHQIMIRVLLLTMIVIFGSTAIFAHKRPDSNNGSRTQASSRNSNCEQGRAELDMSVNNVRSRLRIGGDIWWDGDDGKYVVPNVKPGSGEREVSSLFAGGVWLGGQQLGGDIFVAASEYGQEGKDFYPGPLFDGNNNTANGETTKEMCEDWDRFFSVSAEAIDAHRAAFESGDFDCANVPQELLGWPGKGNPYFFDVYSFDLPDNNAGLAGFHDYNDDQIYNPCDGDFPKIEIRKCQDPPQYGDEMFFWIYNDNGNAHNQSEGLPIRMEVQAQAFAYATNDEINNMTFYRYKMINRAIESIDSFFFSMWIDPDLGCPDDDYIGCDTTNELMYVYNQDATDGSAGVTCPVGNEQVPTYANEVPILGVDYFEGPVDEDGKEIGMSHFMYYNRQGTGPSGTVDPQNALQYYQYLTGTWQDGAPLTIGGTGRDGTEPTNYAFFSPPNEPGGWSMCEENLAQGDRRTLQSSGPFRLDPGVDNFLIIGVVWLPDYNYPCPSLTRLLEADAIAQNLFDACFETTEGPDAPDLDIIELDEELILVLSNAPGSNNFDPATGEQEIYEEPVLNAPEGFTDTLYRFEGYLIYQIANANAGGDFDDPNYARLIANFDINNGINTIYNWERVPNPNDPENPDESIFFPVLQVEGNDEGIRRTLRVTADQFAPGDNNELVNHKEYYYVALAYAYNSYKDFTPEPDASGLRGQQTPFILGQKNIGDQARGGAGIPYIGTPRPILESELNSFYGEGVDITMTSGSGVSDRFVDITEETRVSIANGTFDGELVYEPAEAPIEVFVYNPLDVQDGDFVIKFIDSNENGEVDNEDRWLLENNNTGETITSARPIGSTTEQIFPQYGISVVIKNSLPFDPQDDGNRGIKNPIGAELEYENESVTPWFLAVNNNIGAELSDRGIFGGGLIAEVFDFVATDIGQPDSEYDPTAVLDKIGDGFFVPLHITDYRTVEIVNEEPIRREFVTPFPIQSQTILADMRANTVRYSFNEMPNVDIVFTDDRSLWSKCIVVEGSNSLYQTAAGQYPAVDNARNFEVRQRPSLLKDPVGGLPAYDSDELGYSWFPGYAVNVSRGERINIFFSENSSYSTINADAVSDTLAFPLTGNDMIWNPTTDIVLPPIDGDLSSADIFNAIAGCQHNIYISNTPYDSCNVLRDQLSRFNPRNYLEAFKDIHWTSIPLVSNERPLKSFADGLIPDKLTIKLRVNQPFSVYNLGNEINDDFPVFNFSLEGKTATVLQTNELSTKLDDIRAVPNPYYAFSEYEVNEFSNTIKITNLPPKCSVTIYSLDGKFIRQYDRNTGNMPNSEWAGTQYDQYNPALQWDLKNYKGIPVASGLYLIHIDAGELGEKVVKWFGIGRAFDSSGL